MNAQQAEIPTTYKRGEDMAALLERLRLAGTRIVLYYGDTETGRCWDLEQYAGRERGRIGRSTGRIRIPLLVKTRRSMGGEAILDDCIVRITYSVGGADIYRHPDFHFTTEANAPCIS